MYRAPLAAFFFAFAATPASACWAALDPAGYARECPIVVRGPIFEIDEALEGRDRADDVAHIRVDEVYRNDLKDVPLKVGDKFAVRMVSRKSRVRASTDLHYPLKTEAIWLVVLTTAGEFRIDAHPVQKQAVADEKKLKLGRREVRAGKSGDAVDGRKTKAEWIAEAKAEAQREAEAVAVMNAKSKLIRDIGQRLAKTDKLEGDAIRAFRESPPDVRRDVFQLMPWEGPLEGDRLVAVAEYVLKNDPDENVRTFAAVRLGYSRREGEPVGARTKVVLAAALADASPSVRLYACQSLHQRGAEEHAGAAAKLLRDPDAGVRCMAVTAVGRLGHKEAIPAILELSERGGTDAPKAWEVVEALARLGETKAMLGIARRALEAGSDRIIYSLSFSESRDVVPVLMENLLPELRRDVARLKAGMRGEGYANLCKQLEKRTGKTFGTNPAEWFDWWEKARGDFSAAALGVDRAAARAVHEEYLRLLIDSKKERR